MHSFDTTLMAESEDELKSLLMKVKEESEKVGLKLYIQNTFESVLMRWMKLEPIIQSEVSQKEKHQYSILTHYVEFRKKVTITLNARQQKRHRCIEQSLGLHGRE